MRKVVCVSPELLPQPLVPTVDYFTVYRASAVPKVSTVGTGLLRDMDLDGLSPSIASWDFLTFALAVSAADQAVHRDGTADGWTRMIELEVALCNPQPFQRIANTLTGMLRMLTGDFWTLSFVSGGEPAPRSTASKRFDADCVSLLSGGVDSLVGAIDLSTNGRKPLYVSQMAKGDSETQVSYARRLGGDARHFQWNHNIRVAHVTERSTRARSIVFFAFAALAANELSNQLVRTIELFVPENGFISLNVPLNAGRAGSLSTKTTHPVFLTQLQGVLNSLAIPARLERPYAFKTKGELIRDCLDQRLLTELISKSTSCGRFGYYNYTHCGRCVPCLVRRASFISGGLRDSTQKPYKFWNLQISGRRTGANDIGAVAAAVLKVETQGIRSFMGAQLSFASSIERPTYERVVLRGIEELGVLLRQHAVL
ncbi:Qat anti-phage system QueC-like protein QatC [Delftia tsuruhatensis]|uniref:Qat anti-phage system QueC-like protein QatC n=1 Tax=Delftia tsuruhatensis TaxID=180282 RepID=UPI00289FFF2C|nr:Qat anti-phage system QueC-like protein QatC [Delftia tsuruhatensis]